MYDSVFVINRRWFHPLFFLIQNVKKLWTSPKKLLRIQFLEQDHKTFFSKAYCYWLQDSKLYFDEKILVDL